MKKRNLVILTFLLALYIVPLILVPTSYHTGIVEQPNSSKEFSSSAYGDESDQSIYNFSETLEDDVLFYPDAFVNTTPNFATDGGGDPEATGDYTNTHQMASAMYTLDASSPYEAQLVLVFADIPTLTESNFVSITINLYAQTFSSDGSVTTKDFLVYSRDGPALVKNGEIYDSGFGEDYGWLNVTLTDPNYFHFLTQGVTFYAQCSDNSSLTVSFKYAEITVSYMTLADAEHYAEPFSDVSDWAYMSSLGLGAGEYSLTTDGDVATIEIQADSTDNEYVIYSSTAMAGMSTENYAEIRYSTMAGSAFYCYIQTTTGNGFLVAQTGVVAGETRKSMISQISGIAAGGTITLIRIYCDDWLDSTATTIHTQVDYLRVGPSTEMGWQHDGSTTEGITPTSGDTVSSDGDIVTLVTDVTAGSFEFLIDTTTTASALSCAYYPFLSVNITSLSDGDAWRLWQYDGSAWAAVSNDEGYGWTTTTGLHRYNIRSLDTEVYRFRFNVTATALVGLGHIKANSIANFTVTPNSCESSDLLYVNDSGGLVSEGIDGNGEYIAIYNDYALNVDTEIYNVWNITLSGSYDTAGTDFVFRPFYDTTLREYNYDETRGDFLTTAELDNFYFYFYDTFTLSAITFIDTHDWHDAGEAIIYFNVPYDYWALNMSLLFGGLILMLVSACLLAKKIRDRNISKDATMILLLLFFVGWGLFIGGAII